MNKIILIIIAVLGLAAGVDAKKRLNFGSPSKFRSSETGANPVQLTDLGEAPNFRLKDDRGREVSLADFRGRPVLINSWAVWCPFCREELKDLAAAQKEFGGKVVIVAIDRAESPQTARRFTDEVGVSDGLIFLLDPKDSFYQSIGGFFMPETIFVDREGRIRIHKRGPMKLKELREKIDALLTGS